MSSPLILNYAAFVIVWTILAVTQKKVYFDHSGTGGTHKTLRGARSLDIGIYFDDIDKFEYTYVPQKKQTLF